MNKSKKFLSGFANTDIIDDIYVSDIQRLRPGSIVSENEDQYKIEVGIPYMEEKDIKVSVQEDKVIVVGEKPVGTPNSTKHRTYKGVFEIPAEVLGKELGVEFKDGLLTVILPKKRIAKQFQRAENV